MKNHTLGGTHCSDLLEFFFVGSEGRQANLLRELGEGWTSQHWHVTQQLMTAVPKGKVGHVKRSTETVVINDSWRETEQIYRTLHMVYGPDNSVTCLSGHRG